MAMQNFEGLSIVNDFCEKRKLLNKLPDWLVQLWTRIVAKDVTYFPSFS